MKKLVLATIIFLLFGLFFTVNAQSPDEEIVDRECSTYLVTVPPDDPPKCNSICARKCLNQGQHCAPGNAQTCIAIDLAAEYESNNEIIRNAFNPFDIELCPDAAIRPPDDPYCTLSLVRLGFYAVLSGVVFITVVMGLWVIWERSTAGDNAEKIEKSSSIARNAIIGFVIAIFFIAVVQLTSLIVGLTGNLFEFSIVPQPTVIPNGGNCDVQGYVVCESGTTCQAIGATHICRP